jgi:hypothetical protein
MDSARPPWREVYTMTCQDDASVVGPVALFLGVETDNWSPSNFVDAANFAKKHGIDGLIVKVSEVTSTAGDIWYGGLDGVKAVKQAIEGTGVKFLPYMFLWGDKWQRLASEVSIADILMTEFGRLCLDMEGSTWSNPQSVNWADAFNATLAHLNGKLFVSLPANPVSAGQLAAFQALAPSIDVYAPMAYSNSLEADWLPQLHSINSQACIQPTLDLSAEFGPNDPAAIAADFRNNNCYGMSIWEMGFAMSNPTMLDNVIAAFKQQEDIVSVQLNAQGCVLDIVKSFQLENGESQDLCGPWTVSSLRIAGQPTKGAIGTAEDVDTWADNEANKYQAKGQFNWPGTTIQQMYDFMTDSLHPVSKQRNIHWWDLATPDIAHIRLAVQAGYPVIITASEQNIIEKKSGQRAYPWNLNANHILCVTGIDAQGDFICPDQLNNSFQGYWPPVYLASRINPSWASVIQVTGPDPSKPWLKAIPSNDPTNWPHGFNAQEFTVVVPTPTPTPTPVTASNFDAYAEATWKAFSSQFATYLIGAGLTLPTGFPNSPPINTKIYYDWKALWQSGKRLGPPLTFEISHDEKGQPLKNDNGDIIIAQHFPGGDAEYNVTTHATDFFGVAGHIGHFA